MTKKSNVYNSLGLSIFSEDQFNSVLSQASKEFCQECIVRVEEFDEYKQVKCGPLSIIIDNGFIYASKTYPIQGYKPYHNFDFFIRSNKYTGFFKQFAKEIFIKHISKELGKDIEEKSLNASDQKRLWVIVNMIFRLAPPKGKTFNDLCRIFMYWVWQNANQDALSIVNKISGIKSDAFKYNLVVASIEDCKRICEITPSILPLFFIAKEKQFIIKESSFNIREKNNVTEFAKNFLAEHQCHSKSVWKFICNDIPPRWMSLILSVLHSCQFNLILKLLVEVGYLPKYTVLRHFLLNVNRAFIRINPQPEPELNAGDFNDFDGFDWDLAGPAEVQIEDFNGIDEDVWKKIVAYCRKMFKESKRKPAKTFWNNEASLVFDWVSRPDTYLDRNQRKFASWEWMMRKQRDWHVNHVTASKPGLYLDWESIIDPFDYHEYRCVPLNSSKELEEEGEVLSHCVKSYDADCFNGFSRIFSIQKKNKRIATLEIIKVNGTQGVFWKFSQIRGFNNKDVSVEIKKVGKEVLRRYNVAQKKINQQPKKKQLAIA